MLKRALFPIVVLLHIPAAATAQQSAASSSAPGVAPEPSSLFERVIANQKKEDAALEVYERIERVEIRKNANAAVPASVKIARVIPSGTGMTKIPVAPDRQPADSAAYRASLAGLEHALELIANDNHSQRAALEKYAKRRKDRNELIDATRNAFQFKFVAREQRGGLELSKYEMSPNPTFKATSRFTAIFTKVHGFVWVDENSQELARIEGDVTEDISIGLFLGKIYKGSHFMQERYEVQPGLWLPSFSQYDFDGRKLFSGFSMHERTFYSNYRYIGPPKEALDDIRKELERIDLGKGGSVAADKKAVEPGQLR